MAANLVVPEKNTTASGESYEEPIDIHNDGLAANGFYPQNSTSNDMVVGVERNAAGDLSLKAATQIGQVLFSLDGATFTKQIPLVGTGWLHSDDGYMLVVG